MGRETHTISWQDICQDYTYPNLIFFISVGEAVNAALAREIIIQTEVPEETKHGLNPMFAQVDGSICLKLLGNPRKEHCDHESDPVSGDEVSQLAIASRKTYMILFTMGKLWNLFTQSMLSVCHFGVMGFYSASW